MGWKASVDGQVYAEPLSFKGSVFVATENDTLYSLSASTGAIQWTLHLGTPANSTAPPYVCDGAGPDIAPSVGITGTPVIDPTSGNLYLTALTGGQGYALYAIDLQTGHLQWALPISPSGFNYLAQEQRGALTLANGLVYVPFGGFSWDCSTPYGWLVALSANGNGTEYSFQTTTTNEADIWAPEGASVDSSGFVYVVTGNSYYNSTYNYADSVLKLTPHLSLVSYFAPSNWAYLGPNDLDQDTTGATLLPGNLIFSIGKSGVGYLLNASNLGGVGGQLFDASVCGSTWGSTAYAAGIVYVPCPDGLHALAIHGGAHPTFTSLWNSTGYFAGPPIIADGAVWTSDIYNGTLFALNPLTGTGVASISLGSFEHFTTPSVAGDFVVIAADETIYALDT